MIKAVIFDYGKVVSSAPNTHVRQDIADAYGVSQEEIGVLIGKYIGDFRRGFFTEDAFWEKMSSDLQKPIPQNKYDLWRSDFSRKLVISLPVLNFVEYLKNRSIKVAVLSNNIMPYVEVIRQRGGYNPFDVVVNSCEVGCSKPDKQIYLITLNMLGIKDYDTLFVDDREENLETAKLLNMQTLLAINENQIISDIKKML